MRVDEDSEIVMFSPEHEHTRVIEHMIGMTGGKASAEAPSPE